MNETGSLCIIVFVFLMTVGSLLGICVFRTKDEKKAIDQFQPHTEIIVSTKIPLTKQESEGVLNTEQRPIRDVLVFKKQASYEKATGSVINTHINSEYSTLRLEASKLETLEKYEYDKLIFSQGNDSHGLITKDETAIGSVINTNMNSEYSTILLLASQLETMEKPEYDKLNFSQGNDNHGLNTKDENIVTDDYTCLKKPILHQPSVKLQIPPNQLLTVPSPSMPITARKNQGHSTFSGTTKKTKINKLRSISLPDTVLSDQIEKQSPQSEYCEIVINEKTKFTPPRKKLSRTKPSLPPTVQITATNEQVKK